MGQHYTGIVWFRVKKAKLASPRCGSVVGPLIDTSDQRCVSLLLREPLTPQRRVRRRSVVILTSPGFALIQLTAWDRGNWRHVWVCQLGPQVTMDGKKTKRDKKERQEGIYFKGCLWWLQRKRSKIQFSFHISPPLWSKIGFPPVLLMKKRFPLQAIIRNSRPHLCQISNL